MANNTQSINSSSGWKLIGNALTGTEFLGSTNAQPVIFKANNLEVGRFYSGSAFVLTGDIINGIAPNLGAGRRLMWIPAKAAFRAGEVLGTQWDQANIGMHSYAIGNNNQAAADSSGALGVGNTIGVNGVSSFLIGNSNTTNAGSNVIIGQANTCDSAFSTIIGVGNNLTNPAKGSNTVLGSYNTIDSAGSFTMGTYNTVTSNGENYSIGRSLINTGQNSVVIGSYASSNGKNGSFIIGDSSTIGPNTYVQADVINQFKGRFAGGWKFNTDDNYTPLSISGSGQVKVIDLVSTESQDVRSNAAGELIASPRSTRFVMTQSAQSITANTTSAQNIIGTGVGSLSLPSLQVGDVIRVRSFAQVVGSVSTSMNGTFNIVFNGVTIATAIIPLGSRVTPYLFTIDYDIIVKTTTSITIMGAMIAPNNAGPSSAAITADMYMIFKPSQSVTLTTVNSVGQSFTFSAIDGNAAWSTYDYTMELLRT